jgi:hypothetical protein
MITRSDNKKVPFLYIKNVNKDSIERVIAVEDFQIGTSVDPGELDLNGRLSLNTRKVTANNNNLGVVSAEKHDSILEVINDYTGTVKLQLPTNPRNGQILFIKDCSGNAGLKQIDFTTTPSSRLITSESYSITQNYGSALLYWNESQWKNLIVSSTTNSTGSFNNPISGSAGDIDIINISNESLILVDTTSSNWPYSSGTIYLPDNPSQGLTLVVKDAAGNSNIKRIIVDGNGNLIDGCEQIIISNNYASYKMTYTTDFGWMIT